MSNPRAFPPNELSAPQKMLETNFLVILINFGEIFFSALKNEICHGGTKGKIFFFKKCSKWRKKRFGVTLGITIFFVPKAEFSLWFPPAEKKFFSQKLLKMLQK